MVFLIFDGTPATITFGGTLSITTDPAAIIELSPISILGMIVLPALIKQFSPIFTYPHMVVFGEI